MVFEKLRIIDNESDPTRSMSISRPIALHLELKLNLSEYGHTWSHIGDDLFNFMSEKSMKESIKITGKQFDVLSSYLKNY